jgi:uracil-DNA glycosylase family 4
MLYAAIMARAATPPLRPAEEGLERLAREVHGCRRCPRLVAWREEAASDPPRRFRGQRYWARPVSGFGDPRARIVLIGLAPAANGANRTGRMFTGDRSGEWLYAALHRAGLSNRAASERRDDGLRLRDAYVTAVNRCPPPANRPTPAERDNCLPYLARELALLKRARVLIALGAFAWDGALRALRELSHEIPRPRPRFGHGAEVEVGPFMLLGCFHPSQQNTFTGRLTEAMMDAILARARELGGASSTTGGRRGEARAPRRARTRTGGSRGGSRGRS